jgi:hypothetical protein
MALLLIVLLRDVACIALFFSMALPYFQEADDFKEEDV